jgi:uncharacterized protein (TIGR02246 family)
VKLSSGWANGSVDPIRSITMKRFLILAAASLVSACGESADPQSPDHIAGAPSYSTAVAAGQTQAIHDLIAEQSAAWAAKDAAAYGRTYTADTEVVNPVGGILTGSAAVTAQHAFLFNPAFGFFRNSTSSWTVRSISFLTGTTALVKLDVVLTGFSGLPPGLTATEPGVVRTRVSWIAVKQGQQWRIMYQQMTAIAPTP